MNLPSPPEKYDRQDEASVRDTLNKADKKNHKRGQDIEVGKANLVLTDTESGARYALQMISGVLTAVLL